MTGMPGSCGWPLTAGSVHPRKISSTPLRPRTSIIRSTSPSMRNGGWWTSTPTRASPAPLWRSGRISSGCWPTAGTGSLTEFWSRLKQEAGASAYFNAAFFSHYNTLDVSFTANNPLQQAELSNLCNSQAVFTEGVWLINPAGEIISANSFIEQLEEQQQTAEQHVYFQNQRNNSIAYKSCRLSCALKEAWKAECVNEGKQFDITAIDASYEMRIVKIPINMSVSTVPKYIVMYLLAQHQKILKKTEEGFQICG